MKKGLLVISFLFSTLSFAQKEIYELRIYELKFDKPASILYNYLEKALIPALNKNEIYHIGVFEEIADAMPKKIYLLIPYKSIHDFYQIHENLKNDKAYELASKEYMKTPQEAFPFF
ncbi:MAG: NIPSNAP family containing protein, partial [Flavobacteriales bacterium]|nr:NIPSNAP family containing protein [Flavobacteriales bacterium]